MSERFDDVYESWLESQANEENNLRRREMLRKGLSHGTETFLRDIWFPAVGSFDFLHPEYEVRDLNNRCRYLDLAYRPYGAKGCIEIQDYRSHARDVDAGRFKDLCMKQASLVLDDWLFLTIAYLSIKEDPGVCKQQVLAFVGKFLSMGTVPGLSWSEAETIRYARRIARAFTPGELAAHLSLSENRTRTILRDMVRHNRLLVASGNHRYRTYRLSDRL